MKKYFPTPKDEFDVIVNFSQDLFDNPIRSKLVPNGPMKCTSQQSDKICAVDMLGLERNFSRSRFTFLKT